LRETLSFFLDNDVDVAVRKALIEAGYTAWSAAQAAMSFDSDDALTVYAADRSAVLLTHDREFSTRRRANVVGRHVWLACDESEAVAVLFAYLDDLAPLLENIGHFRQAHQGHVLRGVRLEVSHRPGGGGTHRRGSAVQPRGKRRPRRGGNGLHRARRHRPVGCHPGRHGRSDPRRTRWRRPYAT
jgi:hypothetical protein